MRYFNIYTLSFFIINFLFVFKINGQDNPCSPQVLTFSEIATCANVTDVYTGNTGSMTASAYGNPGDCTGGTSAFCGGDVYPTNPNDIWVQFTIPVGITEVRLDMSWFNCSSCTANPGYAFYTGNDCTTLTYVTGSCEGDPFDNIFCGTPFTEISEVLSGLTAGDVYYLRAWETDNETTDISVVISDNTPPSNDLCANAAELSGEGCNNGATNTGEPDTYAPGPTACSGGDWSVMDNAVWYTFTVDASTTQPIEIDLINIDCDGTGGGTLQMGVWQNLGCGTGLTLANLAGCAVGTNNVSLSGTLPNGDYYLVIDGFNGSNCLWEFDTKLICDPVPLNVTASSTICQGDSLQLTATPQSTPTAPDTITSYLWTPSTGLSNPNIANPKASPTTTTTYTVFAFYNGGCQATETVEITVDNTPVVSASPNSVSICSGSSTTLNAISNLTGTTFEWFDNSGTSAGTGNTLTTPNLTASTFYTVRGTNNSCTSDADTVQISVNEDNGAATCVNIYVDAGNVNGTGDGTQDNPTGLLDAINKAACNNSVIKMQVGTYNIDNPITLNSFLTLEGGFLANWTKTSTDGTVPTTTHILRSNNNVEGLTTDRRLVGLQASDATGFRLQDLTIEVADAITDTLVDSNAVSVYGIHLNNCSEYDIVRCRVIAGDASHGRSGKSGADGDDAPTSGNEWAKEGGAGENSCIALAGNAGWGGDGAGGALGGDEIIYDCVNESDGISGTNALNYRNGGGGGGGGTGSNNTGLFSFAAGSGANGGSGGGGAVGGNGAGSGGGAPAGCGIAGQDGANGANGVNGTNSANGNYSFGTYFVPGTGIVGQDGAGGSGGQGGGGASGDYTVCIDGVGSGGGGGGGGGQGGAGGQGGFGGGASFGIYLSNNGVNSNIIDSDISTGTIGMGAVGGNGGAGGVGAAGALGGQGLPDEENGGDGGTGGNGGDAGKGGDGANGISLEVYVSGTALATADTNFTLTTQPIITASNVNCTNRDIEFNSIDVTVWGFGIDATNTSGATTSPQTTQYTSIGRKDITKGANTYTGFHNIAIDDANSTPTITTDATSIGTDTFQVCMGNVVNFFSSVIGDSITWDFNGAITGAFQGTTAAPTYQNVTGEVFNTKGFFLVEVSTYTDCCGDSPIDSVWIYVDSIPNLISENPTKCKEDTIILTLRGSDFDSVTWSPTIEMNVLTDSTIQVFATTSRTYTATAYNTTGSYQHDNVLRCPASIDFNVTMISPEFTMAATPADCNDGTASVTITTATGTPIYTWENGLGNGSSISGLSQGFYTVTVSDDLGCEVVDSVLVPAGNSVQIASLIKQDIDCYGNNTGAATISGTNGTRPYTYAWTGGISTDSFETNLAAGNYCVTITDDNACEISTCFDILQPDSLNVIADTIHTTCINENNGFIAIRVGGGTAPYTYQWDAAAGNSTNDTITNLAAGDYTVTITDDSACTKIVSFTVPALDTTSSTKDTILCFGETFNLNSNIYTVSGTYTDTILGGASTGCDSFRHYNVTILPLALNTIDTTVCEGDLYNGVLYTSDTILRDTLMGTAVNNCDSIIVTNITIDSCGANAGTFAQNDTAVVQGSGWLAGINLPPNYTGVGADTMPNTTNYSYTYLIADYKDSIMQVANNPVDLSTYPVGVYQICGLSYRSKDSNIPTQGDTISVIRTDLASTTPSFCGDINDCVVITILETPCPEIIATTATNDVCIAEQPSGLFISEYIEGSGNNKCIEIYNGTGSDINLTLGNYHLLVYTNGSNSASSIIVLGGIVANGDVFVICNPSADDAFLAEADQTSGSLNYNGDDAIALADIAITHDIFGNIGCQPEGNWSNGSNSTANTTLVRTVTAGNVPDIHNEGCAFPTLGTEWQGFPEDHVSNLGSHTIDYSNALCVGDTITIDIAGQNLNTSDAIQFYSSNNPNFNPYNGEGTLIGSVIPTSTGGGMLSTPTYPTPILQSVKINACNDLGEEGLNEFVIVNAGNTGFDITDLFVNYNTTSWEYRASTDVQQPLVIANLNAQTGCDLFEAAPSTIPANRQVIIFHENIDVTQYDFSFLCGTANRIYVVFTNAGVPSGNFNNGYGITRTFNFSYNAATLATPEVFGYTNPSSNGNGILVADGTYANWTSAGIVNSIEPAEGNCFGLGMFETYQALTFKYALNNSHCNSGVQYIQAIIENHPDAANPTTDEGTDCEITNSMAASRVVSFCVECPEVTLRNDTALCQGDTLVVDAGSGFDTYTWSTTETSQIITVDTTGQYIVTVTNKAGCTDIDTFNLTIDTLPIPMITGDTTICTGDSTTLDAGAGFTNYQWSSAANDTLQTIRAVAGTYYVTVTNTAGCQGIDSITITTLDTFIVEIDTTICFGGTFTVGSNTYDSTDTYIDTLNTISGCDSIITLNLTIYPQDSMVLLDTIEQGDVYNGEVFLSDTTLRDTLAAASVNGCDVIDIIRLSVIPCNADAGDISHEVDTTILILDTAALNQNFTPVFNNSINGFTGTLDVSDNTFHRSQNSNCGLSGFPASDNVYYEVYPFTVDMNDNYQFDLCSPDIDGFAAIYRDNFDPNNLCDGYLASDNDNNGGACDNDPSMSMALVMGVQYYLITATNQNNDVGEYTWTFSSGSGGNILGGADPATYVYTYIITDSTTGNIVGLIDGPNMLGFAAGTYYACGFSYLESDNDSLPATNNTVNYNDFVASLSNTPPSMCAAVTSTCVKIVIEACPLIETTIDSAICEGNSVTVGTSNYTITGNYRDTLTAINKCDSIVILNLTVVPNPTPMITGDTTVCSGATTVLDGGAGYASYQWYNDLATLPQDTNQTYEASVGTYYLQVTNAIGCIGIDTIIITNLNIPITNIDSTICELDSVVVGTSVYYNTGLSSDTLTASNGCDSIINLDLTVNDTFLIIQNPVICEGDTIRVGTNTYTTTGNYTDVFQSITGCDSTVQTDLTVNPNPTVNIAGSSSFCVGSSTTLDAGAGFVTYSWLPNGEVSQTITVSTAGTYHVTVTDGNGCTAMDSIVITQQANLSPNITGDTTVCTGDSTTLDAGAGFATYTWQTGNAADTNQTIRAVAGQYIVEVRDASGCTGRDTITVTELNVVIYNIDSTICELDSVVVGTSVYYNTGLSSDTLIASNGCDSIINLDLTVNDTFLITQNPVICQGDTVTVGTNNYTTTGNYTDVFQTINGCDSTVQTNLTVNPNPTVNISGSSSFCVGSSTTLDAGAGFVTYSWLPNGEVSQTITVSTAGTYHVTVTDANGCVGMDSIVMTETAGLSPMITGDTTVCVGDSTTLDAGAGFATYTWQTGNAADTNQTIRAVAGQYIVEVQDASGCIGRDTITVTELNAVINNIDSTICELDSVVVGTSVYYNTGLSSDTLIASNGCDSIINLDLTVNDTFFITQNPVICEGDTVRIGTNNYTTTGNYIDVFQTINGCDSTIITNLTVNMIDSTEIDTTVCAGGSYTLGTNTYTTTGNYRDTLANTTTGCDSIIKLNLIVLDLIDTLIQDTICQGDTLVTPLGGRYTMQGNYPYDSLISSNGCDSVINVDLTVFPSLVNNLTEGICAGDTFRVGTSEYTMTGMYSDTLTSLLGCDSIINLDLNVGAILINETVQICQGDSYNGTTYFFNTTLNDTIVASGGGCDTISEIQIIVGTPLPPQNVPVNVCLGDTFRGVPVVANVIYRDTFVAQNACDSIIVTSVNAVLPILVTVDTSICTGDTYLGVVYTSDTTFMDTTTAVSTGCDSITTVNITILFPTAETIQRAVCVGDPYLGIVHTSDTILVDTLIGTNTCDSILTTELTILQPQLITIDTNICELDTFKQVQIVEDTVLCDTFVGANTCDSVVCYNIMMIELPRDTITQPLCEGDTFRGVVYVADAILSDTLTAVSTCDSIVTTLIVVSPHLTTVIDTNICESYTYLGVVYPNDTTLNDTLSTVAGCDSFVITNITILPTPRDTIYPTVCLGDEYLGVIYPMDTILRDTFNMMSSLGCDSIRVTYLEVLPTNDTTLNIEVCQGDMYDGITITNDTILLDTVPNQFGCDSAITTNVTMLFPTDSTRTIELCFGDVFNGIFYPTDTTLIDTLVGSNTCDSVLTTILIINPLPTPMITGDTTFCFGDSVILTVNAHDAYSWQTGNPADTTQSITVYNTGDYIVTVTDGNGCMANDTLSVVEFDEIVINGSIIQHASCPTCANGVAQVAPTGGSGAFIYTWDNGHNLPQRTDLQRGTYCVTITDAQRGCEVDTCFVITSSGELTTTVTNDTLLCNGDMDGEITIQIDSGVAYYVYTWIEDGTGISGGDTIFTDGGTDVITGLGAGIYTFYITDSVNVKDTVVARIIEPAALTLNVDDIIVNNVNCKGGSDASIIVTPTGGTTPYTFTWQHAATLTAGTATNLSAGIYTVQITDANGCSFPMIPITVNEPTDSLMVTVDTATVSCTGEADGQLTAIPTGGSPSYTFLWSDGQITGTAVGLAVGTYTVTVTDENKCTAIATATIGEPTPLAALLATPEDVNCYGEADGIIAIDTVLGGVPPYEYTIDGFTYKPWNVSTVGLPAGTYDVSIQDANGCTFEDVVIIGTPSQLIVDLGADIEIEMGDSVQLEALTNFDASIDTFFWTPTDDLSCTDCLNPYASPLRTQVYTITVIDTNGCSISDQIEVDVDVNRNVYIPTGFSPNGDGSNDVFMVYAGKDVAQVDLFRVFDRWGELIYEASNINPDDPAVGWDGTFRGKNVNPAVFIYYIEVSFIDGHTKSYKGDITLMR